mmetsp:Transcript_24437/g.60970  ORF Transcript_24437/g.60970 Transcript_24437/m.60970 type:complete len:464 (-) Transcript_24437:1830-3221(-)
MCASAAANIWSPDEQKRLLEAAYNGKSYLHAFSPPLESSDDFISNTCTSLRILNAVRETFIGIPLTLTQLQRLTLSGLIRRLALYGEFDVAEKLARKSGKELSNVLSSWAISRLQTDETETIENIIKKFASETDGAVMRPYAEVALAAVEAGRPKDAVRLLRLEGRIDRKAPLFVKLGDYRGALLAAAEFGDYELFIDTFKAARRKIELRQFADILAEFPERLSDRAFSMVSSYLRRANETESLLTLYSCMESYPNEAILKTRICLKDESVNLSEELNRLASMYSRGRKRVDIYGSHLRKAANTSKVAQFLEETLNLPVGSLSRLSSCDLIHVVIVNVRDDSNRRDLLSTVRDRLKIPGRQFLWTCMAAMKNLKDVRGLFFLVDNFNKGKSPVIPLERFVEVCIELKSVTAALQFCERITDSPEKARSLAKCNHIKEAMDLATGLRSKALIEEINGIASSSRR